MAVWVFAYAQEAEEARRRKEEENAAEDAANNARMQWEAEHPDTPYGVALDENYDEYPDDDDYGHGRGGGHSHHGHRSPLASSGVPRGVATMNEATQPSRMRVNPAYSVTLSDEGGAAPKERGRGSRGGGGRR